MDQLVYESDVRETLMGAPLPRSHSATAPLVKGVAILADVAAQTVVSTEQWKAKGSYRTSVPPLDIREEVSRPELRAQPYVERLHHLVSLLALLGRRVLVVLLTWGESSTPRSTVGDGR